MGINVSNKNCEKKISSSQLFSCERGDEITGRLRMPLDP
jgi:hypothetical protein